MATENENNSSTVETTGTETEGQQQETTPETGGNGTQQQAEQVKIDDSTKLPDTHPLVKTLATQKDKLKTTQTELTEARAQAARVTQLEDDLKARPTTEAVETLQKRNDRLEEFLVNVGGPLSSALDSRTFTRDLFESDKPVADIVKDFLKKNPSATSQALSSAAAGDGKGKADINALLRAANQ
jgi:hypothetical protein